MGLLWRLFAPKPLKKARRTVRKAAHPVHTATRAMTPKPVKQLQRAAHPFDLMELKTEDAIVKALRGKPRRRQQPPRSRASRTQERSAQMSPPAPWRPRPGWGTIRDYELLRDNQGGTRVSCTFIPDDSSEPVIVDTSVSDDMLPEIGEFARAVMYDPEDLTIKVGVDAMERAEGMFREVNSMPLAKRVAMYGEGEDDIYGDCGWTWTSDYKLVKAAPGLLIER